MLLALFLRVIFMVRPLFVACCLVLASVARAQDPTPVTLEQAMANPDWIGRPVESAWWSWDSRTVNYTQQRTDSNVRDQFQVEQESRGTRKLTGAQRAEIDGAYPVSDTQGARMAFVRNGDVFVRELSSGRLIQVTRSVTEEASPQWSADGQLVYRSGKDWFVWRPNAGVTAIAPVKVGKDPAVEPKRDTLQQQQLALFKTLRDDVARKQAAAAQSRDWRAEDPTQASPSAYIDGNFEIQSTSLSPNGRWMLAITQEKGADTGRETNTPKWITETGYTEPESSRTLVGRTDPVNQQVWLVDVQAGKARQIALDGLPGIQVDPLKDLRAKAGKDPLKGSRAVRIQTDGDDSGTAVHWTAGGDEVAFMVRAVDNKDRWIVSLAPKGKFDSVAAVSRHRLTDPAWINWNFNDFGYTPDNRLWYLSEQSGYSHLYLEGKALTSGRWEASDVTLDRAGKQFFFVCNRANPGTYELCTVNRDGGSVRELTSLKGVEGYAIAPNQQRILVRYSGSYLPTQVATIPLNGGQATVLTDTRSPEFKSRTWIQPEYVQIPSKHGAGTIWGKFYGPAKYEAGRKYPIVFFVHGAGYLQNVSQRYPAYFREQMFHNLLVERGYVVMDIDYRASEGYGRDWRTAIYRQMGHPELEDHLDALDWVVANKQGDKDKAGIYGGSYGGFMTFMALMRAPGTFKAGAALRPVADWAQYNHEYTSNILNTPELDPEAYRKSSPIYYADQLQDRLLIAHGMIDDNVFYRDSVMLAQRLIELRKTRWEVASYPMERHGFVNSDSWYDEYRRIYELFETELK